MANMNANEGTYTVPGLSLKEGHQVAAALQDRLHALNDLQLTLKHAHWNVVGRSFIGVHEMLDPQIDRGPRCCRHHRGADGDDGCPPSGHRVPWSRSAPGTTTHSGAPASKSIWLLLTWSTTA
ncbi:MAG: ferritin-like domain-containing protein [Nocardioidaceae bacterium]